MKKQNSVRAIILCLIFFIVPALADRPIVLRADRMLDVTEGKLLSNCVVIVEGRTIKSVGVNDIPVGAQIVNLGNMTLLPGLIDMHTHLTMQLDEKMFMRRVTEGPADEALRGAHNAEITLMAGFTTVRNVGSGNFVDVALMKAIDQGLVIGPHIFPAAYGIGITGGHCDATGFAPGIMELDPKQGVVDGVDEAVKAVRYQIKHGAKWIKICATAGVLSFEEAVGAQQLSNEEMKVIVEEASRHGIKVAAHAHGTEGIIAAVNAGVASIEHGSMLNDEAIRLMKRRGTYLVPTTYLANVIKLDALPPPIREKAEYILPIAKERVRKAIRAGVKIAFGTDAAVYPHGDNAKEFAALVEKGMSNLEAIRCATIYSADLLGVDDRGVLEPGHLADIVAVAGNPLEDIRVMENVRFVMKAGKIYKKP